MSFYNSRFTATPIEIILDHKLKDRAKLLLSLIYGLERNGTCYATNKAFSDILGGTPESMGNLISELVKKGYLLRKLVYKQGTKEIEKRYLALAPKYEEIFKRALEPKNKTNFIF